MALTVPRLQSQDLILTCAEPLQRAAQEHTVRAFTPSAMTGSTFTDANVSAAAVGLYVVPEDGDAKDQARQIISVSGTTATIDGTWASTTGTTRIRAWQPAGGNVVVTTADAGAPFDVIASAHAGQAAEPDTFWTGHGYQLIKRGGANSGKARAVTTFTTAAGTFADGAADATIAGDLFLLRQLVRPEGDVEASIKEKSVQRRLIGVGRQSADVAVPITREGSLTVKLPIRPIATAGASGVVAGRPVEISHILEDLFTRTSDTGGTVVSASSTIVDNNASALTAGGFLLLNTGELIHILAASGADVAAYGTGQLTNASVTASSVAHASTWYKRRTGDTCRTRLWDLYRGGKLRQVFHGCMPTVKLSITRDEVVSFELAYMGAEPIQYNVDRPVSLSAVAPITIQDTGVPVDGKGARCIMDGVRVGIREFTCDFGFAPKMRPSLSGLNQYDGCAMDVVPATGTISALADIDDISGFVGMIEKHQRGKPFQFLYQKGAAAKNVFGLAMPAMQFTDLEFKYTDMQGEFSATWTAVDPEATGLYPVATYPGLPDLSIGWA